MTTNEQRGSATIFQFPARGRFAMSTSRDENSAARELPRVSYDSWYHQEAIEAERAREN